MIRRLDVPGGMAKRTMSGPRYAKRVFTFIHNIIGHYFPARFLLLYPAYIYFVAFHCIEWICSDSKRHDTWPRRIAASTGMALAIVPLWLVWLAEMAAQRLRDGAPPHNPRLVRRPLSPIRVTGELVVAPSAAIPAARGERDSRATLAS
jgi:hypothetical protein